MKMSRRAKRMQRHHKRKRMASINLVSLMDIFTILVFFLLVNSSSVQQVPSTKALKLPESTAEKTPKETLVVLVNNQDILVAGRKVISVPDAVGHEADIIPELLAELTYQAEKAGRLTGGPDAPPGELTIMGDRQIPYLLLKKIMITSTKANYTNLSLAVMKKHQTEG